MTDVLPQRPPAAQQGVSATLPAPERPTPTSRRGEAPPKRFRHRATIILSAITALLLLAVSSLDGSPDAAVNLATGIGFSSPSRWWLTVPAIAAAVIFAVAVWLPAYQPPSLDWAHEKRKTAWTDAFEADFVLELQPSGEYIKREKTLAEMGLEAALASAEAELAEARATIARLTSAPPAPPTQPARLPLAPPSTPAQEKP